MKTMKIKHFIQVLMFGICLQTFAQVENIPLVTVTGESVVYTNPDKIIVGIIFQKTMHSSDYASVLDIFKSNETDIRIFGVNQQKNKESLIQVSDFKGKAYDKEVFIELTDVDKLESLLIELNKQNLNMHHISYEVQNKEDLLGKVQEEAMADAKQKAKSLAGSLYQDLGDAHTIDELESQELNWYRPEDRQTLKELGKTSHVLRVVPTKIAYYSKIKVSFDLIKTD